MKKAVLLLLAGAVVLTPAAADAKKKTKPAPTVQKYDQYDATWRLLRDGVPLILPSWALPVYFSTHDEPKKKTKKTKM